MKPRNPVVIPLSSVEVFLDDLLPSRQSVAPAPARDYGRSSGYVDDLLASFHRYGHDQLAARLRVPICYALSEIADRASKLLGVFDGAEHVRCPAFLCCQRDLLAGREIDLNFAA